MDGSDSDSELFFIMGKQCIDIKYTCRQWKGISEAPLPIRVSLRCARLEVTGFFVGRDGWTVEEGRDGEEGLLGKVNTLRMTRGEIPSITFRPLDMEALIKKPLRIGDIGS
jgi:hypothetical protein